MRLRLWYSQPHRGCGCRTIMRLTAVAVAVIRSITSGDPIWNRLVSTAFKNCLHMHQNNFFSSNLHEKSGIDWIERKSNLRFFRFFIFRAMVIFVTLSPQISMDFHNNLKNKNRKKNYFIFHSIQHIPHLS